MVGRVMAVATILLLGVAIGGAGLLIFDMRATAGAVVISTAEPTPEALPTATETPLQVYVNGAVAHPDVYVLPPGSRIKQAIAAAGGYTASADTIPINLAQEVHDGMYIYVTEVGETPPSPEVLQNGTNGSSRAMTIEGGNALIDINSATKPELETLPGIGPSTAQKIVDYREAHGPFPKIESILEVPGIGEVKFAQIRDLISTGN